MGAFWWAAPPAGPTCSPPKLSPGVCSHRAVLDYLVEAVLILGPQTSLTQGLALPPAPGSIQAPCLAQAPAGPQGCVCGGCTRWIRQELEASAAARHHLILHPSLFLKDGNSSQMETLPPNKKANKTSQAIMCVS